MVSIGDRIYRVALTLLALALPLLLFFIASELVSGSLPALKAFGLRFLTRSIWDPVTGQFGVSARDRFAV